MGLSQRNNKADHMLSGLEAVGLGTRLLSLSVRKEVNPGEDSDLDSRYIDFKRHFQVSTITYSLKLYIISQTFY